MVHWVGHSPNIALFALAGPLSRHSQEFSKHVRKSVQRRQLGMVKPPRLYPSLPLAVAARMQTATNFPGNQYLSETAATELVLRGAVEVNPTTAVEIGNAVEDTTSNSATLEEVRGWQFRHDPRLQWPSIQYCTNEQVEAIYQDIKCPVALLLATDGWPFDSVRHERTIELLRPTMLQTLPGSHHFHADPETADAVVAAVANFLKDS
jgi:hypothetical protein